MIVSGRSGEERVRGVSFAAEAEVGEEGGWVGDRRIR